MKIPAKVLTRFKNTIPKYKRVVKSSLAKDVNEADTVKIVAGILEDILGYDLFGEITSEYKVRNQYVDLAIVLDSRVSFFIEVKRIGQDLKDTHLKQVVHYATDKGLDWVILSNGLEWAVYKVIYKKPTGVELVFSLNFGTLNLSDQDSLNALYTISREGLPKSAIAEYHTAHLAIHRHRIGESLFTDNVLAAIRRELKKRSKVSSIDVKDIQEMLALEVVKREIIENSNLKKPIKALIEK